MLTVRRIEKTEEFKLLRNSWDELLSNSIDSNLFLSWEWMFNWWGSYGKNKSLNIIEISRCGDPVSYIPCYVVKRSMLGVKINTMKFIGTGEDSTPEYINIILNDKLKNEDIDFVFNVIESELKHNDLIELDRASRNSLITEMFVGYLSKKNINFSLSNKSKTYLNDLPDSWGDFYQSMSKNNKSNYRRLSNKITKTGCVVKKINKDTVDMYYSSIVGLHKKRWRDTNKTCSFSSEEYNKFHLNLMKTLDSNSSLLLLVLEFESLPIGFIYCYKYKSVMYYIQSGFDPKYSHLSPGKVLLYNVIDRSITEGCSQLDLLSGDHEYKNEFCTKNRSNIDIFVYSSRFVRVLYVTNWFFKKLFNKIKRIMFF